MAITAALAAARKASVATTTFNKLTKGAAFAKPVKMTPAQVKQVGTQITAFAKTNPDRAGALLQRMLDLNGQGKIKVTMPAGLPAHAAGNVVPEMSNKVRLAILKIDPNANVPAYSALARGGPPGGVRPRPIAG